MYVYWFISLLVYFFVRFSSQCNNMTCVDFYVNQWVDILDANDDWMEAQIFHIFQNQLSVRYLRWKKNVNKEEVLDSASPRIAAHLSKATPMLNRKKIPFVKASLDVGVHIDCLDTVGNWYSAVVVRKDLEHDLCLVHYEGFTTRWDEWIEDTSYRLADCHSYVDNPACISAIQLFESEVIKTDRIEEIKETTSILRNLAIEESNIQAALVLARYYLTREQRLCL